MSDQKHDENATNRPQVIDLQAEEIKAEDAAAPVQQHRAGHSGPAGVGQTWLPGRAGRGRRTGGRSCPAPDSPAQALMTAF
jgi:hypothetical protein